MTSVSNESIIHGITRFNVLSRYIWFSRLYKILILTKIHVAAAVGRSQLLLKNEFLRNSCR